MTGMTIKTSDGKELKFRIVEVPLYLEKGLTKGMSVKITYRGELQSEDSDQKVWKWSGSRMQTEENRWKKCRKHAFIPESEKADMKSEL